MLSHATTSGGVFHLWGHSWELQEAGLWGVFETFLARVAEVVVATRRVTNTAAYARTNSPSVAAS